MQARSGEWLRWESLALLLVVLAAWFNLHGLLRPVAEDFVSFLVLNMVHAKDASMDAMVDRLQDGGLVYTAAVTPILLWIMTAFLSLAIINLAVALINAAIDLLISTDGE